MFMPTSGTISFRNIGDEINWPAHAAGTVTDIPLIAPGSYNLAEKLTGQISMSELYGKMYTFPYQLASRHALYQDTNSQYDGSVSVSNANTLRVSGDGNTLTFHAVRYSDASGSSTGLTYWSVVYKIVNGVPNFYCEFLSSGSSSVDGIWFNYSGSAMLVQQKRPVTIGGATGSVSDVLYYDTSGSSPVLLKTIKNTYGCYMNPYCDGNSFTVQTRTVAETVVDPSSYSNYSQSYTRSGSTFNAHISISSFSYSGNTYLVPNGTIPTISSGGSNLSFFAYSSAAANSIQVIGHNVVGSGGSGWSYYPLTKNSTLAPEWKFVGNHPDDDKYFNSNSWSGPSITIYVRLIVGDAIVNTITLTNPSGYDRTAQNYASGSGFWPNSVAFAADKIIGFWAESGGITNGEFCVYKNDGSGNYNLFARLGTTSGLSSLTWYQYANISLDGSQVVLFDSLLNQYNPNITGRQVAACCLNVYQLAYGY